MMQRIDSANERRHFDRVWAAYNAAILVEDKLDVPTIGNLEGKRILICSCGSGVDPVRAANAGAEVYAVDISEVAVENARKTARFNNVTVNCDVQDLHDLKFGDRFFDLVYGTAVLHHLDVDRASREFCRVLRPGGLAVFESEPTFMNPLLKHTYEFAFGKGRVGRRRKFLFLRRTGTECEKPLDAEEFDILRHYFSECKIVPRDFMFFEKLSHVAGGRASKFTRRVDSMLLKTFPGIRKWSYECNLVLRAPQTGYVSQR